MKRNRLKRVALRMLYAHAPVPAAALVAAPVSARADYAGFTDVGASDWYVTDGSLDYALDHGLLKGCSTAFCPSGQVIRADVVSDYVFEARVF